MIIGENGKPRGNPDPEPGQPLPCTDPSCANLTPNGHLPHDVAPGVIVLNAPERELHGPRLPHPPGELRSSQENMIKFLDLEVGRQRWEIQQIINTLSQVMPDAICLEHRCRTISQGRMFPHIRTTDCAPERM